MKKVILNEDFIEKYKIERAKIEPTGEITEADKGLISHLRSLEFPQQVEMGKKLTWLPKGGWISNQWLKIVD